MSLTTYCEFDEIRSVLGVNALELSDQVLGLPVYEMGLLREFNRITTSLTAAFSPIFLKSPSLRSAQEVAFYQAVRLFSVYAVAKQVGVSLANFAPKAVGDGKSSIERQASAALDDVLAAVDNLYGMYRTELKNAYQVFTSIDLQVPDPLLPRAHVYSSKRLVDVIAGV